MVTVRLYRDDKVLHPDYDGVWKIYGMHPRAGWVWLEAVNDVAKAVSLWTDHGMLAAQRSKLEPLPKEQDRGIC